jgi:hypothetical protein
VLLSNDKHVKHESRTIAPQLPKYSLCLSPPRSLVNGFGRSKTIAHKPERGIVAVMAGPQRRQLPRLILNFFGGFPLVHVHSFRFRGPSCGGLVYVGNAHYIFARSVVAAVAIARRDISPHPVDQDGYQRAQNDGRDETGDRSRNLT